jgi:Transcriptional regulators
VTNEEESDALGVPLHSPAFLFERTTRAASGEIVEYVRSIYRGDRYKLVTELNRSPAGRNRTVGVDRS